MPYEAINFQDAPSTATPLNAATLNQIDQALVDLTELVHSRNTQVNLHAGWLTGLDSGEPVNYQVFRSKAGIVSAGLLMLNSAPDTAGLTVLTLPANLCPGVRVTGVGNISWNGTIIPTPFSIEPTGELRLVDLGTLPTESYTFIVNLTYII